MKNHPEAVALAILILLMAFGPLSDDPRTPPLSLHTLQLQVGDGERIELPIPLPSPNLENVLPHLPGPRRLW